MRRLAFLYIVEPNTYPLSTEGMNDFAFLDHTMMYIRYFAVIMEKGGNLYENRFF